MKNSEHPGRAPLVLLDGCTSDALGASWRFSGISGVLQATKAAEVLPVLVEVERAAAAGWYAAGFVAYEAAAGLNPDLVSLPPRDGLPLAWFALYRERRRVGCAADLPPDDAPAILGLEPLRGRKRYTADIGRIRDYIAAGDSYQVNYTMPLVGRFAGNPLALYRRVCDNQQAPFCACIDTGEFTIISASPELFFELREGRITTRPMKGTARRGRWPAEDREAAARLAENPKERAENLMIVDLLRNDLGMVAETGSVQVDRLFAVERYPTVLQMTSTVTARPARGTGLTDIFRSLFPCGSVTGAPKRRSMELIASLEGMPRGVYCGAIGYVAPGGEALFSVAIRTLQIEQATGRMILGVGSGVTWDSDAGAEYAECLAKSVFTERQSSAFDLIETLRREEGAYYLLERHLARLAASAAYFGRPCDPDRLRRELEQHAPSATGLHKVRLLLAPDGMARIDSEPLHPDPDGHGLRLGLAAERVAATDPFCYHKTTRRERFDRCRALRPDCDELLFINHEGELAEASYHTLVLRLGADLVTPPLSSGLLPGVLRAELLERGEIVEGVLAPADLHRAEEIWLINSVRGWRRAYLADKEEAP